MGRTWGNRKTLFLLLAQFLLLAGAAVPAPSQDFLLGPQSVSVVAFGATGDGVHDDTAAIQSAVDSLPASGGVVYFPPGNYVVTRTIQISKAASLVGSHKRLTRLYAPDLAAAILRFTGTRTNRIEAIEVSNLSLSGPRSTGIVIDWVIKSKFADLYFYGLGRGILANYSFSNQYSGIATFNVSGDAITLGDECGQSLFLGNALSGNNGVKVTGNTSALTFLGNSFTRVQTGILLSPISGDKVAGVVIESNYFEVIYGSAIVLAGADSKSVRAVGIRNNYFYGGSRAWFSSGTTYAQAAMRIRRTYGFQIHGNEFLDWAQVAIDSDSSAYNGSVTANSLTDTPKLQ